MFFWRENVFYNFIGKIYFEILVENAVLYKNVFVRLFWRKMCVYDFGGKMHLSGKYVFAIFGKKFCFRGFGRKIRFWWENNFSSLDGKNAF